MKIKIGTISSEEQFHMNKERFNAHQTGTGVIKSSKDKAKNRNSKASKALKHALKTYCL